MRKSQALCWGVGSVDLSGHSIGRWEVPWLQGLSCYDIEEFGLESVTSEVSKKQNITVIELQVRCLEIQSHQKVIC